MVGSSDTACAWSLAEGSAAGTVTSGGLYQTRGGAGGCTGPSRQADVVLAATNALNLALPPQSVTVLVLKP